MFNYPLPRAQLCTFKNVSFSLQNLSFINNTTNKINLDNYQRRLRGDARFPLEEKDLLYLIKVHCSSAHGGWPLASIGARRFDLNRDRKFRDRYRYGFSREIRSWWHAWNTAWASNRSFASFMAPSHAGFPVAATRKKWSLCRYKRRSLIIHHDRNNVLVICSVEPVFDREEGIKVF